MTHKEYSNVLLKTSGTSCAMHISGGTDYRFKVVYPFEGGQTIPAGVTTMRPRLLVSHQYTVYANVEPEMSTNHAFIPIQRWSYALNETRLYWCPIDEEDENIYVVIPDGYIFGMCTVSDNVCYIVVEYWNDPIDHMQLQKVTFTELGGTIEVMYEWEWSDSHLAGIYELADMLHVLHVKYGEYDCIYMNCDYYLDSGTGDEYKARVIIYNINTDTAYDTWFSYFDYNPDLSSNDLNYEHTTATIYQNKIIFGVCTMWGGLDWEVQPVPEEPQIAIIIIDITNGSINILDNITRPWEWWSIDGGAMDYTTYKYYFAAWYEPDSCSKIYSVNMTNPTTIVDENISLSEDISLENYDQGKYHGFLFDDASPPSMTDIYSIPDITKVATIYNQFNYGFGAGGAWSRETDLVNNMIWVLQLDKLEGKSLNGGADRDIIFTTPLSFTYPTNQRAYMRFLDGKAVVQIYSHTTTPSITYQNEWYLLE